MLFAFPLQQKLLKSSSMSCYMHNACLANCKVLTHLTALYSTWPPLLPLWDLSIGLYAPFTSFTLKVEKTLYSETVQLHMMWLNPKCWNYTSNTDHINLTSKIMCLVFILHVSWTIQGKKHILCFTWGRRMPVSKLRMKTSLQTTVTVTNFISHILYYRTWINSDDDNAPLSLDWNRY
jgi:hypothetical protein